MPPGWQSNLSKWVQFAFDEPEKIISAISNGKAPKDPKQVLQEMKSSIFKKME